MPPIINFKICDNSADCGGISNCHAKVFYWDDREHTIKIDENKCTGCGACENFCNVKAIHFAADEQQRIQIQKEIDADPRRVQDLFMERYGATPLDETFIFKSSEQKIKNRITSSRPVILEFNQTKTIECLLKSVPITDIQESFHKDATYSKFYITENDFSKYGVKSTPCLRFYYRNKLLGQIDEYFTQENKSQYLKQITNFGDIIR